MTIGNCPRFLRVMPEIEVNYQCVTHPSARAVLLQPFDLHALDMPPAFILSQDQTLSMYARCIQLIRARTLERYNLESTALCRPEVCEHTKPVTFYMLTLVDEQCKCTTAYPVTIKKQRTRSKK